MSKTSEVTNEDLVKIYDKLTKTGKVKAWQIVEALDKKGITLDESTIRGRFIEMGKPLSSGFVAL